MAAILPALQLHQNQLSYFCLQLTEKYGDVFTVWMGPKYLVVLCGYEVVKDALVDHTEEFGGHPDVPFDERVYFGCKGNPGVKQCLTVPGDRAELQAVPCNGGDSSVSIERRDCIARMSRRNIWSRSAPTASVPWKQRHGIAVPDFDKNPDPSLIWPVFKQSLFASFYPHTEFALQFLKNYPADGLINPEHRSTYFYNFLLIWNLLGAAHWPATHVRLKECIALPNSPPALPISQASPALWKSAKQAPEMEDRVRMPFTNAGSQEILRYEKLSPENFPRAATLAKIKEHNIPQGTAIRALLISTHLDPLYWETPEQFNPNHFLDEKGQFRRRETEITFSLGEGIGSNVPLPWSLCKRACSGEALPRVELSLFLSTLLQTFTFQLVGDTSK
ncbi:cytochrome P450 2C30-like [Liasis olivaceus]